MSGHRQAAAALHGLSGRDRGLILAELPAPEQRVLRGYLAELDELGFESGPAQHELPREHQLETANTTPAPPADPASIVRTADATTMLDVLGAEPASLIAHFLTIEAWPWSSDFMKLLAPTRRALVRAALGMEGAPASARQSFLLETAAAALGPRPAHQTGGWPRVGAFFGKVKSWKR